MSVFFYSHNDFSRGGRELARLIGIPKIKHTNSNFVGSLSKTVINWGSSNPPHEVKSSTQINHHRYINTCSNKLTFFQKMEAENLQEYIPEYTTSPIIAKGWAVLDGRVVVRHILRGSQADGLEIWSPNYPDKRFPIANLYTRYFKRQEEYRVHVAFNQVIDVQRKARKLDVPDHRVNWEVRNLQGGFIYARNENHVPNQSVYDAVKLVHEATNLDFGAYDVLWNSRNDKAVVLEVNTAPGLQGTTQEIYADVFRTELGL